MCPSNRETSLTDAVKNQSSPGNENDARTPNSATTRPVPNPKDDLSTVGQSDAPKKPVDPADAQAEIPDPTSVGEAG
jgi:hypothetical protein